MVNAASPSILELGGKAQAVEAPLRDQILQGLRAGQTPTYAGTPYEHSRSLPTVLVYDDLGLSIYDEITRLKEYYPFNAELQLLQRHGPEIAKAMFGVSRDDNKVDNEETQDEPLIQNDTYDPLTNKLATMSRWGDYESGRNNNGVNGHLGHQRNGSEGVVIELGAGALTKTKVLLRALHGLLDPSTGIDDLSYYAVDLEHGQLVSTLTTLAENERDLVDTRAAHGKIHIRGVRASYEEAFPHLKEGLGADVNTSKEQRQSILWLGSSIGNFDRPGGAAFLKRIADDALKPGDTLLLGIDGCGEAASIELAYNDPAGVTRDFILNGVQRAANIMGTSALAGVNFEYVSRFNADIGAHEAFVRARRDIHLSSELTGGETIDVRKGELLAIEKSYKFNESERTAIFSTAGLRVVGHWTDENGYSLYVLERPAFVFPSTLSVGDKNPFGAPTLGEWKHLWTAFDTITLQMVTTELLHTKPIDLRHICLFYIGHIPAFLDIHLSRYLKEGYTEPAHYPEIFERGIDPNVDDPENCHQHSEVPTDAEDWPSLAEILAYRDRVRARLHSVYNEPMTPRLARTLAMVYEHEAMHAETLLYMLLQVSERIRSPPGFAQPDWAELGRQWATMVASEGKARLATVAYEAGETGLGQDDNDAKDGEVAYDERHAFGWDNESPRRRVSTAAFRISLLPISNAEYSAFWASQSAQNRSDLLPASWLPSSSGKGHDVRVLQHPGRVSFDVAQHWPVQASGEQLAAYARSKGGRLPTEAELRRFFDDHPVDALGRNVGFAHWHPLPPALPHQKRDGTSYGASNGGVWEWTSTDFAAHEGFKPSALYPLYSVDFHDGHHAVVLGGSYLTIPRMAGRRSFRNFYQRKYPYAFIGGRVAYDA